jgi:predicted ATP-dependent serine protease
LFCRRSGLVWEIRPVNRVDQRIQEAEKLGLDHFCIQIQ